jgi:calcium-dependent protein kinase
MIEDEAHIGNNGFSDKINIKIIDFGVSSHFKGTEKLKEDFRTPYYTAPEIFKGSYTASVDVWSAGIIMYILLKGTAPYQGTGSKMDNLLEEVAKADISFNDKFWEDQVSEEAVSLLKQLLDKNPDTRISAAKALQMPWF